VWIQGEDLFRGCGFGLKHCDENNPCPLHYDYAPIRYAINKLVEEETVQSMAKKYAENKNTTLSRFNLGPE
jgi:Rrf2 family iron-sulfur cluster assembly transcriptional regulator